MKSTTPYGITGLERVNRSTCKHVTFLQKYNKKQFLLWTPHFERRELHYGKLCGSQKIVWVTTNCVGHNKVCGSQQTVWVTTNCVGHNKMLFHEQNCRLPDWMCLVGAGIETSPVPAARASLACAALGLVEPAVPNFACKWHEMTDFQVSTHQYENRYLPSYRAYI
jgi:hypothetical protein